MKIRRSAYDIAASSCKGGRTMASSVEFVEFVVEQLREGGTITYKRMFGEYGIYCNGIYFACICDDRFLVKVTEAGKALMPECPMGIPYEGGSAMLLIEELDDVQFLGQLTRETCSQLPLPKPRKKKAKSPLMDN